MGVLLRGTKREDVERGQVLAKPVHHPAHRVRSFRVRAEQGRRRPSHPFFANYRPQFYFRTTDVTGAISLKEGVEMVMPGDNVEFSVALIAPIAMEDGLRFAIREGGRTVGAGVVAKIISKRYTLPLFRPVAQLVEYRSPKPRVGVRDPPGLPNKTNRRQRRLVFNRSKLFPWNPRTNSSWLARCCAQWPKPTGFT